MRFYLFAAYVLIAALIVMVFALTWEVSLNNTDIRNLEATVTAMQEAAE